jgi:hypothetical protein
MTNLLVAIPAVTTGSWKKRSPGMFMLGLIPIFITERSSPASSGFAAVSIKGSEYITHGAFPEFWP